MKEIDLQKLLCDAVNDAGGFAFKSSNRFLIGVADCFVKLSPVGGSFKSHTANPHGGFIEVKKRDSYPMGEPFELDVTVPQLHFLRANDAAGAPTGVASFIVIDRLISVQIMTLQQTVRTANKCWADAVQHIPLGGTQERKLVLLRALHNWHKDWREGR